ncbi:ribosomal L7Ae/L30e/S12e/Gadd45 family protein [Thermosyntropha sp.]|uniref:L7Ae/L30e/S12e/Gadd45 family ribosomal protein n=1 Tax=Thermosyntropha sp. TaxID=2740820 RepID=UPI0025EED243|nr:ribosomal L7Ae/L30e/S12e/Gadd45 family protein [Thermosyntropha sp.]MBO8159395.1 ribosomal L7Ae/L30e/S12e/Gadd45 family protein [Thermosyntropha sp.]
MQKIYSIIGFAQKAGKVSSGVMAAKSSIIRRKASLLIMSNDIAANTRESLVSLSEKQGVPFIFLGNKYELGTCIGKAYRVAVTINDKKMAETIMKALPRMGDEAKSMGVFKWPK